MRKHKCMKAIGRRSKVALLRCGKPAKFTIRGERGRIIAWLCRKHHEAWTNHIGRLLASDSSGYRRTG